MHRLSSVITAVVLLASSAFASVAAECQLTSHGGLPWVEVRVAGSPKPLSFILDTGAAATVLDRSAAERLGVKLGPTETVIGVHSLQQARRVNDFTATVAGLPLPRSVLALDLRAASRTIGRRIDGLVGADFLRGRIVQLDARANVLRVLSSTPLRVAGEVLPVRMINSAFCVPVRVNDGGQQWVRVDTGCIEALRWVGATAASARGARAASIGLASTVAGSSRLRVRLGTMAEVQVRAVIRTREIFAGEAGLLGNKLLSRFRMTVDGAGQRVILEPL